PTTEPLKEVQFKMGTDNLWQTGFDFSDAFVDAGVWSYRLTGLELEAKAAVNANINVTAAYSYTDAEYTHDTVFNGKRPAEVP
ncbi:hypothetical protein PXW85_26865, partial [Klebsiella pneumoniae]|uniref:hypothetical protein n=1 Tax=Klebsiella pneumoniae TaxID=573 RepID=UPI0023810917